MSTSLIYTSAKIIYTHIHMHAHTYMRTYTHIRTCAYVGYLASSYSTPPDHYHDHLRGVWVNATHLPLLLLNNQYTGVQHRYTNIGFAALVISNSTRSTVYGTHVCNVRMCVCILYIVCMWVHVWSVVPRAGKAAALLWPPNTRWKIDFRCATHRTYTVLCHCTRGMSSPEFTLVPAVRTTHHTNTCAYSKTNTVVHVSLHILQFLHDEHWAVHLCHRTMHQTWRETQYHREEGEGGGGDTTVPQTHTCSCRCCLTFLHNIHIHTYALRTYKTHMSAVKNDRTKWETTNLTVHTHIQAYIHTRSNINTTWM